MALPYDLAVGEWWQVPDAGNSQLADVYASPNPGGSQAAIMTAWGGAAWDSTRKRLLVSGGGHNDYAGNEVYAFEADQASGDFKTWRILNYYSAVTDNTEEYADGTPSSAHGYACLVYDPFRDKLYRMASVVPYLDNGTFTPRVYEFAASTNSPSSAQASAWTRRHTMALSFPTGTNGAPQALFDPLANVVWWIWTGGLAVWVPSEPTDGAFGGQGWQRLSTFESAVTAGTTSNCALALTVPRRFVSVGGGSGFLTIRRLDTYAFEGAGEGGYGATGDTAIQGATAPGVAWDHNGQQIVAWAGTLAGGTDNRDYYTLNVTTGVWTRHAGTGDTPDNPTANGVYGRFAYVGDGLCLVVNSTTSHVYFVRTSAAITLEQEGYRWRADDGSETAATWLAAQDTPITRDVNLNTRLRVLLNTTGDAPSQAYQLEYRLSTGTIWTPVVTPSGSVAYGSTGTAGNGTTALTLPFPTGIATGDLLVLCMVNKYPTNAPTTPTGWTLLTNGQIDGGAGAAGVDSGTVYATVYVREANGFEGDTDQSVTITSGNTARGVILRYTKGVGKRWSTACASGSDNSAGTAWSVTGGSDPGISGGDMVVVCTAVNSDARTFTSQTLSSTGVTYGTMTERSDAGTNGGDDCGLMVCDFAVTSGTSSAAPVFTATASGTAGSNPAGASVILRIRQVDEPIVLSASANIAASGEATTAQLTAPSGKTTSDFLAGRVQDDENPSDAVNITTADYTELEWCVKLTSTAVLNDTYHFRVTQAGVGLDVYTVTPQMQYALPPQGPPSGSLMRMGVGR